jgi:short-subunit dehydrogenase
VTGRLAEGDVRLLISNAGAGGYAPLEDVEPDEVDRLLTLNATAPIQLVRAALPGMRAAGAGAIVTVASLLAFSAGVTNPHIPKRTLYAAAKAATVAFTRTLAAELDGTGIRAQVVCPGVVATDFDGGFGKQVPFAMQPEDVAAASLAGLRLGEVVCVPGLENLDEWLSALEAAESALITHGNNATRARRYREVWAGR